jgi:uroporphyrinogen-III synthase
MKAKSLDGRTVLVAASEDRTKRLALGLRRLGAVAIPFPTVRITPPADEKVIGQAIRAWASYDWVVFTSTHGVDAVVDRARFVGIDLSRGARKIAAVGPATRARLESAGLHVDSIPEEFLTDAIPEALGDVRGRKVLLPRSRIAGKGLAAKLKARGATVVEVDAYDAVPASPSIDSIREALRIDFVVVTSASAARNLLSILPSDLRSRIRSEAETACIGPVTAEAARDCGLRVTIVAREHTLRGILESLSEVAVHE